MTKGVFLVDCDSTLSSIEGIDELARARGASVYEPCRTMTDRAMDGSIPLDAVYGKRLELIKPTLEECVAMGGRYIEASEPGARELMRWLVESGWTPVVVSDGITQAIEPFAAFLGVDRIEAVTLDFDDRGRYVGFDPDANPTARPGGKIEVARRCRLPGKPVALAGDGASDLEAQGEVDLFIGYGGVVEREKVEADADAYVRSLSEIPSILAKRFPQLA